MAHMNSPATRVRKSALMFMAVGLSFLSAATLAGQGPFAPASGPLNLILQKLDALQVAVASLAPPPEPSVITLRTSAIDIEGNTFVICNVTNVSASTIEIKRTLLDAAGAVVSTQTLPMAPGLSQSIGQNVVFGVARCEFTFTGFADDIRANMTAEDNQLGVNTPTAVFEAR